MQRLPLLTVNDLTCARAGRVLAKDLSIKLLPGELLILMGPNGSGKTTLLRSLAGIPESHPNVTKSVTQSYLGHLNALKRGLTVRQNLLLQTGVDGAGRKEIRPFIDREIRTLSAGQRRQVALARLALSGAKLWLLDEPTTHLDEEAKDRFWSELEGHLRAGGACVMSSHTKIPISQSKVITLNG